MPRKRSQEKNKEPKDFDALVYRYGLKPPFENKEIVIEQMILALAYGNELARLERGRRTMRCACMELYEPFSVAREALLAASSEAAKAAENIRKYRKEDRKLKIPDDLRAVYDAASEAEYAALKEFVKQYHDVFQHVGWMLRRIEDRAVVIQKELRKSSGVFWGTYLLIEAAAKQSRLSMPEFHNPRFRKQPGAKARMNGGELNLPGFKRWNGQGNIAVQIQKGKPLFGNDLFGQDNRVRIDPVDSRAWLSPVRGERRKYAHTYLHLQVGSNGRQKPILASWWMAMHRPLPTDANVKWVKISLRRFGTKTEWAAHITLETRSRRNIPKGETGRGAVGVDIGWRKIDGQLRTGMWWGEDGEASMELRLTEDILSSLAKCDKIKSRRDKEFNEVRDYLVSRLASTEVPHWLRFECRALMDWRSEARLKVLLGKWSGNRFDNDQEAFDRIAAWAYHDNHLYDWEANKRTRALRRRLQVYQNVAAKLATSYDELVLEDFDLGKMVMKPELGKEEGDNARARANRVRAAIAQFRMCLILAFKSRGKNAWKIPAYNTTKECHITGVVEDFDAAREIRHTTKMGTSWDQDDNAARNLVQRFRQDPSQAKPADEKKARKGGKITEVDEVDDLALDLDDSGIEPTDWAAE